MTSGDAPGDTAPCGQWMRTSVPKRAMDPRVKPGDDGWDRTDDEQLALTRADDDRGRGGRKSVARPQSSACSGAGRFSITSSTSFSSFAFSAVRKVSRSSSSSICFSGMPVCLW